MNLRNRTGEARRPQPLWDKRDNNFVFKYRFVKLHFPVKWRSRQNKLVIALPRLSHKSILPSRCVNSLRSLIGWRLQEKNPLCGPFYENLHVWWRNALKGEKELSVFRTIQERVDGHLIKQVPFLFFFFCCFCAWLRSWQDGESDEFTRKS